MLEREQSSVEFEEIDLSHVKFINHLGRGTFGSVHKALWNDKLVAMKVIDGDSDNERECFIQTLKILKELNHKNIVKVFGSCLHPRPALALELMENGSMHDLLHRRRSLIYKADHVFSWARQCADAIAFMHKKRLVHRDLKPANLLLKNAYHLVKVCDFGTLTTVRSVMSNNRGSASWMAPEVFSGSRYDSKCDVYSFGIILWEMITRRMPFEDFEATAYTILWNVCSGSRPPLISDCPKPIMDLITCCWDKSPNNRPSMTVVLQFLEELRKVFPDSDAPITDSSLESIPPEPDLPAPGKLINDATKKDNTKADGPSPGEFLTAIDQSLMPPPPLKNSEESQKCYMTHVAACKELFSVEARIRLLLRENFRHKLQYELQCREPLERIKTRRDFLRSLLFEYQQTSMPRRAMAPPPT
ncbi:hypothetical protein AB6A40_004831 [Gnathostoma spinigerum]|uniref:Protein kinase domain-containing protein n=1 Tax=Gnathostoma spinigerum TaxID=75299 RepID=A0ABD6EN67_9BILA